MITCKIELAMTVIETTVLRHDQGTSSAHTDLHRLKVNCTRVLFFYVQVEHGLFSLLISRVEKMIQIAWQTAVERFSRRRKLGRE